MIYITKQKNNTIKIITDLSINNNPVIYTFSWSNKDLETVKKELRPKKCLWSKNDLYKFDKDIDNYFIECVEYGIPQSKQELIYVYKTEINDTINSFKNNIELLIKYKLINSNLKKEISQEELNQIVYRCDIKNKLEDIYGTNIVNFVNTYEKLFEDNKEFLKNFYSLNKERRFNFFNNEIKNVDINSILDFLPRRYKVLYKLFYTGNLNSYEEEIPEYRNINKIDGNSELEKNLDIYIRDEFFKVFKIGEIWKGKDIKKEITEIYKKLNIQKSPKVHDIFNYFDTSMTREGYRLSTRKI